MILAGVAAILGPLHHRLTHLLKHKLVHKTHHSHKKTEEAPKTKEVKPKHEEKNEPVHKKPALPVLAHHDKPAELKKDEKHDDQPKSPIEK